MTLSINVETLRNFEDIKRCEFHFGMTLPTTRYFQSKKDDIGNFVLENVQLCNSSKICLHRLTNKKNSVAINRRYLECVINEFKEKEKPIIRVLDDTIVQTPIEMLIFKGNPPFY